MFADKNINKTRIISKLEKISAFKLVSSKTPICKNIDRDDSGSGAMAKPQ